VVGVGGGGGGAAEGREAMRVCGKQINVLVICACLM
jgi:hypothetical protein